MMQSVHLSQSNCLAMMGPHPHTYCSREIRLIRLNHCHLLQRRRARDLLHCPLHLVVNRWWQRPASRPTIIVVAGAAHDQHRRHLTGFRPGHQWGRQQPREQAWRGKAASRRRHPCLLLGGDDAKLASSWAIIYLFVYSYLFVQYTIPQAVRPTLTSHGGGPSLVAMRPAIVSA